jgi:formamidopyrimidine-DNA glycosylase
MPELPDVEGFRRVIADHAVGRAVVRVDTADSGVLRGVTARQLNQAMRGHRFGVPERRGKLLVIRTDGPTLLLHFGMTGSLEWSTDGSPRHRYDRVTFVTDAGELRYRDMRKLQGLRLARDERDVAAAIESLGPDALGLSRRDLAALLDRRRGAIKPLLMDQEVIAGLGNLLTDEILWRARINPRRKAGDLSPQEIATLHREMGRVLRRSVQAGLVPGRSSWLTGVRDRPGAVCPRCGTPLVRGRIGGRTAVWCPHDQPD